MKDEITVPDVFRCYFFGSIFTEDKLVRANGLSGFAVPDLGIIYRSRFIGTLFECQYAGLLSLLQFIESNPNSFQGKQLEILSDSAVVVYHITHRKFISHDLLAPYNAAISYKKRIPFNVSWVPKHENISITGLSEMPPLTSEIELNFEIEVKKKDQGIGKGHIQL